MSVLPLKADIRQREWHVRYVPIADIGRYSLDGFSAFLCNRVGAVSHCHARPLLRWHPYDARVSRAVNDQFRWHLCPLDREFNVQHQLR